MYGKIFKEIFDSSLQSECDGMALFVFMSMIVLADEAGFVRIDPDALYKRMGLPSGEGSFMTFQNFLAAIAALEKPDPSSNLPDHGGRRLIPLSEVTEGAENRGWWIVNYEYYRKKGSRIEKQEQTRLRVRKFRKKQEVKGCNSSVTHVNASNDSVTHGNVFSCHTKTETETKIEKEEEPPIVPQGGTIDKRFEVFWKTYPKKVGKEAARRSWTRLKVGDAKMQVMISAVEKQASSEQWKREGGRFIPNPATWLNQGRWEDEVGRREEQNDPFRGAI